jgi:periplasmic divalent cation tolerance protein
MSFTIFYVTHENKQEANKIADHLLNKKLIACANLMPMEAAYWWNGNIDRAGEVVSILKTRNENREVVSKEIEAIHPYEVPCIIHFQVEANEAYEAWIAEETAPGKPK